MLTSIVAALAAVCALAHSQYVPWSPNGAAVPIAGGGLGHVKPKGGSHRNAYGDAFGSAGKRSSTWSDSSFALCHADSDGDGQTNGFELGDPCCNWTFAAGKAPAIVTDISNPGDARSKSPRAPVNCSAAAPAPFTRLRGAVSV